MLGTDAYKQGEKETLEKVLNNISEKISKHPTVIPGNSMKELIEELRNMKSGISGDKILQA